MARSIFWPSNDSYTLNYQGEPQAGVPVKVYSRQSGGTQVTDLVYVGYDGSLGSAVPSGILISDSYGLLPAFAGPDGGATTLWGNHGAQGERIALAAETGAGGGGGGSGTPTDGSVTLAKLAADTSAAVGGTTTAVKTANYTAAPGETVPVDATSGPLTITLPAASRARDRVVVKKVDNSANAVTIARAGSDVINTAATSLNLALQHQSVVLRSTGAGAWVVEAGDLPYGALTTVLNGTFASKSSAYASGVDYVVGQLVTSSGTLYRVTTAHTSSGAINLGNFTAVGGGGGGSTVSVDGTGAVTVDGTTVQLASDAELATALALKAPLASPALTGTPTAPTAAPGTNSTQVATTAFSKAYTDNALNALATGGKGVKRSYGAVGDMRVVTDGVVTASSTTITSATAAFVSGDVGKKIAIPYAGADNGTLAVGQTHLTTIASVTNGTTAVLAAAPVKSVTGPRTVTDVAMSSGGVTGTVTSATASWTSADIGKKLVIPGAGRPRANSQSADLTTWIMAVVSGTQVTVSQPARVTVSAKTVTIPGAWIGFGTDDTVAFQNASNAKGAIEIEPGRFMTTAEITCGGQTEWFGHGGGVSIVNLCGTTGSTFRYAGSSTNASAISDVIFRDFEIDGSGLRVNTYDSVNKGLYLVNVRRMRIERMYVHDTSATAVGCDFLPDSTMISNVIERGGAQVPELSGTAGGSGIGVGTGYLTREPMLITGNTVRWCGLNGIFTESQSSNIRSQGIRIIGNHVEDCNYGISDRACDGTVIEGNTAIDCNIGIYLTNGFVSGLYSVNPLISGNHIDGGRCIVVITKDGDVTVTNNDCRNAGQAGVDLAPVTGGTLGVATVADNRIYCTPGTARGIWVETQPWDRIVIRNNQIKEPGINATPRPAIVSGASATAMYVTGNIAWDTRGPSGMSYGLQLTAGTIGRLVYDGNDFTNTLTAVDDLTGATVTTTVTHFNP